MHRIIHGNKDRHMKFLLELSGQELTHVTSKDISKSNSWYIDVPLIFSATKVLLKLLPLLFPNMLKLAVAKWAEKALS